MKLLFVSPIFPFPLDRGQHARIFNLLQSCARDFEVTFVGPKTETLEPEQLSRLCKRVLLFETSSNVNGASRITLRARYGVLQSDRNLVALAACAQQLRSLDVGGFDLIFLERTPLYPLLKEQRHKTVLDLDDLEHVKYLQSIRLGGSVPSLLRNTFLLSRYLYRDVILSKRFYRTLVCSREDASYLAKLGSKNVAVVPNGTDSAQILRARSANARLRLLFLGNMEYGPNLDAVEYFVKEIAPVLRESRVDFDFDVIGRGADAARHLTGQVNFRGFVEDLSQAFANYDVFVAPIRVGSGTKLKILDAMANGLPVVTTSIGARGLALEHRKTAMIANSAKELSAAILECCADRALALRLAEAAFQLVLQQFAWPKIRQLTADYLFAWAYTRAAREPARNLETSENRG